MTGVRRYFTPRTIGMHVTLMVLLPVFAWLTWWQLGRALGGNTLSWAYTFEWPLFGCYAVYVWWQLIHDRTAGLNRTAVAAAGEERDGAERREPGWALTGGRRRNVAIAAGSAVEDGRIRGERFTPQTAEEAAQLAEYNRYLAELDSDSGTGRR